MTTPIRFGTDGWRGIVGEDFTFANVRLCAQSVADYLKANDLGPRGLVVGYDTRFASEHFAAAVAEVVAANSIPVYLCDTWSPTPVVSYAILVTRAGGAVIITSSHNPAQWNGFKYKPDYAGSASPEVTAALEARIDELQAGAEVPRLPLEEARRLGLVKLLDPVPPYVQHLAELLDLEALRRAGLTLAIDAMYGAGAGYFRRFLEPGTNRIEELHAERNPLFPGLDSPEPIARNLGELSRLVRQRGASVGLATDGDADRLGIVDEQGNFVNQLQVFALLILYLLEVRGERGPIVKSVTTTAMARRLAELYGVPLIETPVGFKYIGPEMIRHQALIGGEESGGYGFRGHLPERDGILAGLYFLDLMMKLKKTPSQLVEFLFQRVGPHYYDRIDLPFPAAKRPAILQRLEESRPLTLEGALVQEVDARDGFRYVLEDGSWLLVRFSGTEPVLRIYTETDSPQRVQRLLAAGRSLAGV